ncbi:MAG TPA: TRAP transporter small permease [Synergistales bacterium]|nr:TRAP transporter small permease [Synergistales bacterium]
MLFQRFLDLLNKVTRIVMVGILLVMSFILFLQIASRFLVFMPLPWSQELLQYLNIWLVFLGAGLAVKEQGHIKIELFISIFPLSWISVFRIFSYLVSFCLVTLVALQAYELMGKTMHSSIGALPVPMGYLYLSLVVGGALMALNYFFLICSEIRCFKVREG